MATLIIPRVIQIAVESMCSGQPVVNVLHFRYPDGTFINTNDALNTMKTAWEAVGSPHRLHNTGHLMVGYKLTDLSSAVGATGYLASATAGSASGALSTMASAALLRIGGGTRSRSGTGRIYHGPLTEVSINADGRTLDTTAVTAITSAYTQMKTTMLAAGLQLVVASRKNSSATDVAQISVSSVVATQRRRLR